VNAPRERIEWVDAARGIGIVAVVVGHVWTKGVLRDAVYSFHMPLFFLLSGYLFAPRPVGAFTRRQLVSQGVSYAAFLIVLIVVDIVVETGRGHRPIFHDWPADLWRIAYGGSELRGPFTVFWFVPCLVAARIAFNAASARFPGFLSAPWLAMAGAAFLIAYVLGAWTDASPLGLLTAPMAFGLLWAGAVLRIVPWRNWMLAPAGLASLCGLFLIPTLNMKAGDYGWPILSIVGAVATSQLVFRAARLPVLDSAPVRMLGSASLVIMYLHVPIIHYLTPYCGKPVLLVLAILIPVGVYFLFGLTRFTRRVFLAQ
jgi:fucose 4-O-acetylase-like acetyltransferase